APPGNIGVIGVVAIARSGSAPRRKIKARLSDEFSRLHRAMFARRDQHGLAQRDRLEVVPARDIRADARLEGAKQAAHAAGERVGEPGVRPPGTMPLAAVADRGVVDRTRDPCRPARPADLANRQALGPLEPPPHGDARARALARRPRPDVVPAARSGAVL